jgi:ABC-type lipoprotein export system ATPase subunit
VLTAVENVELPMAEAGAGRAERRARALELLGYVGLDTRASHRATQLSGGEMQRVAIARALANHPAIVLADEPTGNLDSGTTAEIMSLLSELNRTQGTTLIVVTHNHDVARATRRMITLRDGKVQQDVAVRSALDSDWIDFKSSSLGQAILRDEGVPDELHELAPQLRALLERV